jgi:hypothetical protein
MEFERSLFRVYERSIEGLLREDEETNQLPFYKKSCKIFEFLVLVTAFFFLFCLIVLHSSYIGQTGCFPQALVAMNSTTNQTYIREFSKDSIIMLRINSHYLSEKGFARSFDADDDYTDGLGTKTHVSSERRKLFGDDINTFHSQPRLFSSLTTLLEKFFLFPYTFPEEHMMRQNFAQFFSYLSSSSVAPTASYAYPHGNVALLNESSSGDNNNNTSPTGPNYDQPFDYLITFDWAVTMLDSELKEKHNFELITLDIPGYNCFGKPLSESLLPFGGLDHAVLNNVIYSLKKNGFMYSKYGDLYYWNMNDVFPYHSVADWIPYKINILFLSFLAFFLLSTTTALLVRVLISSGVIIVFPLFWCFRLCGMEQINLRIIALSYPWIGLPLQIIQFRNQSVYPFVIAHGVKVVIYYLLYVAAQTVYLRWLYNGTSFIQGQLWLYAVMMIWEYFSMIYVRAVGSIQLFPRMSLGLFLIFHFYYYSFPSGFHLLALLVMFLFLVYIMTYCIRVYEVKAFRQGLVNIDQPR